MKRTLLMITYAFSPAAYSGVHRVLHLARFLPRFGWQPIILTVKEGNYGLIDPTLERHVPAEMLVHRTASFELPSRRKIVARPAAEQANWIDRLADGGSSPGSAWRAVKETILTTMFIPDEKAGWIPPALMAGLRICRSESIDAIFSTAPPFSAHVVALLLKKVTGKPWVADFRDPWSQNPFVRRPWLSRKAIDILERKVLAETGLNLINTEPMRQLFLRKHADIGPQKFVTLPNGFDPQDFEGLAPERFNRFTITHAGNFYGYRTPRPFLLALRNWLRKTNLAASEVQVIFIGAGEVNLMAEVKTLGLEAFVKVFGFLPHRECLRYLKGSDLLLVVTGSGEGSHVFIPAKVYEYLGAGRPILTLAPPGACSDLVRSTRTGIVLPPDDVEAIERGLSDLFLAYKAGALTYDPLVDEVEKYRSDRLAGRLASLLDVVAAGLPAECEAWISGGTKSR